MQKMEIQYSPKVDADLEAAFMAESCRSVSADCGVSPERSIQADKAAELLFMTRFPETGKRPVPDLLEEMIAYEDYKASELFILFAREARHDGMDEIAELFEKEALAAAQRRRRLEGLRGSLPSKEGC